MAQEKAPKSAAPFRPRLRHRPKTFLPDDGFPVGQLLERFLIQAFLGYLSLLQDQAQCKSHSVKDGFKSRRTTQDIVVDRDHVVDACQHVVGVKPPTFSRCAGTNCGCELRVGNSLRQSPLRWRNLSSDRAANQGHIGVPGRTWSQSGADSISAWARVDSNAGTLPGSDQEVEWAVNDTLVAE